MTRSGDQEAKYFTGPRRCIHYAIALSLPLISKGIFHDEILTIVSARQVSYFVEIYTLMRLARRALHAFSNAPPWCAHSQHPSRQRNKLQRSAQRGA